MRRKINYEIVKKEFKERGYILLSSEYINYVEELAIKKPNIEVLGIYNGLKVKILHKCKICGYEWKAIPDNLLNNKNGCPKCGKRAKLTNEEFLEKLNEINQNIKPLDEYISHIHKIHF